MAANDLMLYYRSEEQNGEKMTNTAPLAARGDARRDGVQLTVGIPGANAPGMGGRRLKLPRPSGAFFEAFLGFELFPFGGQVSSHLPVPLGSACT